MVEQKNAVTCIKQYMEEGGGRKVTMDELKALSKEERQELGELAALELGVEVLPPRMP